MYMVTAYLSSTPPPKEGYLWFDNISVIFQCSDPIVFTFLLRKLSGKIVRLAWFVIDACSLGVIGLVREPIISPFTLSNCQTAEILNL